ncbi:myosin-13-like [Limanda limanda]|uniref:myosin-13-like n=1 Tax=Limanda limanda TaxID=27771 RepID=UPI0029C61489|nr:myosin-13-like [Limanda limanda]
MSPWHRNTELSTLSVTSYLWCFDTARLVSILSRRKYEGHRKKGRPAEAPISSPPAAPLPRPPLRPQPLSPDLLSSAAPFPRPPLGPSPFPPQLLSAHSSSPPAAPLPRSPSPPAAPLRPQPPSPAAPLARSPSPPAAPLRPQLLSARSPSPPQPLSPKLQTGVKLLSPDFLGGDTETFSLSSQAGLILDGQGSSPLQTSSFLDSSSWHSSLGLSEQTTDSIVSRELVSDINTQALQDEREETLSDEAKYEDVRVCKANIEQEWHLQAEGRGRLRNLNIIQEEILQLNQTNSDLPLSSLSFSSTSRNQLCSYVAELVRKTAEGAFPSMEDVAEAERALKRMKWLIEILQEEVAKVQARKKEEKEALREQAELQVQQEWLRHQYQQAEGRGGLRNLDTFQEEILQLNQLLEPSYQTNSDLHPSSLSFYSTSGNKLCSEVAELDFLGGDTETISLSSQAGLILDGQGSSPLQTSWSPDSSSGHSSPGLYEQTTDSIVSGESVSDINAQELQVEREETLSDEAKDIDVLVRKADTQWMQEWRLQAEGRGRLRNLNIIQEEILQLNQMLEPSYKTNSDLPPSSLSFTSTSKNQMCSRVAELVRKTAEGAFPSMEDVAEAERALHRMKWLIEILQQEVAKVEERKKGEEEAFREQVELQVKQEWHLQAEGRGRLRNLNTIQEEILQLNQLLEPSYQTNSVLPPSSLSFSSTRGNKLCLHVAELVRKTAEGAFPSVEDVAEAERALHRMKWLIEILQEEVAKVQERKKGEEEALRKQEELQVQQEWLQHQHLQAEGRGRLRNLNTFQEEILQLNQLLDPSYLTNSDLPPFSLSFYSISGNKLCSQVLEVVAKTAEGTFPSVEEMIVAERALHEMWELIRLLQEEDAKVQECIKEKKEALRKQEELQVQQKAEQLAKEKAQRAEGRWRLQNLNIIQEEILQLNQLLESSYQTNSDIPPSSLSFSSISGNKLCSRVAELVRKTAEGAFPSVEDVAEAERALHRMKWLNEILQEEVAKVQERKKMEEEALRKQAELQLQQEAQKKEAQLAKEKARRKGLQDSAEDRTLRWFKDLQDSAAQCAQSFDQLNSSKDVQTVKLELQKATNILIDQISSNSGSQLRGNYDEIVKLLSGRWVMSGGKSVSTSQHPQGLDFVSYKLAEKFVKQGEEEVASHHEAAFPIAVVASGIWELHPRVGDLILAHLHKKCPYAVPHYPPMKDGTSVEEYQKILGYRVDDSGIEGQDSFLKRMSGMIRLYAAVIQLRWPYGSKQGSAPHGLNHGWHWLVQMLDMEPRADITATLLFDFLEVCGNALMKQYQSQFWKLILLLKEEYFPRIEAVTSSGQMGSVVRLKVFLETSLQRGDIKPPKGQLSSTF